MVNLVNILPAARWHLAFSTIALGLSSAITELVYHFHVVNDTCYFGAGHVTYDILDIKHHLN